MLTAQTAPRVREPAFEGRFGASSIAVAKRARPAAREGEGASGPTLRVEGWTGATARDARFALDLSTGWDGIAQAAIVCACEASAAVIRRATRDVPITGMRRSGRSADVAIRAAGPAASRDGERRQGRGGPGSRATQVTPSGMRNGIAAAFPGEQLP